MNATRALQTSFQAVLLARRQIDITVQYIRPFFFFEFDPIGQILLDNDATSPGRFGGIPPRLAFQSIEVANVLATITSHLKPVLQDYKISLSSN
jgi:hypothetical protein